MKFLIATLIGIPVTIMGCVLFSGGLSPVESYVYLSFRSTYGFELLIWLPFCLVAGYVVLEAVRYGD
jgi:hypothetical protein